MAIYGYVRVRTNRALDKLLTKGSVFALTHCTVERVVQRTLNPKAIIAHVLEELGPLDFGIPTTLNNELLDILAELDQSSVHSDTRLLVRARSLWARKFRDHESTLLFLMCKSRNLITYSILDGSQSNSGLKYMRVSNFSICFQNAVEPPFACVTASRRSSIPSMSRLMNSMGISLQQSCTCSQS
jgi:hypothetical protein